MLSGSEAGSGESGGVAYKMIGGERGALIVGLTRSGFCRSNSVLSVHEVKLFDVSDGESPQRFVACGTWRKACYICE